MGKIPTIKHGDVVVTEQAAIYMYLAELYSEAGLSPAVGSPEYKAELDYVRAKVDAGVVLRPLVRNTKPAAPKKPISAISGQKFMGGSTKPGTAAGSSTMAAIAAVLKVSASAPSVSEWCFSSTIAAA